MQAEIFAAFTFLEALAVVDGSVALAGSRATYQWRLLDAEKVVFSVVCTAHQVRTGTCLADRSALKCALTNFIRLNHARLLEMLYGSVSLHKPLVPFIVSHV